MKLRFTRFATRQVDRVLADVAVLSPQGAARIAARLDAITKLLVQFPMSGRMTQRARIRRIALVAYPYVVDYRVDSTEVVVLGFRHGSRASLS